MRRLYRAGIAGGGLPTRYLAANPLIGRNQRRFYPLDLQSRTASPHPGQANPAGVSLLSAATGGALDRDPLWRELLGPGGLGDQLRADLAAGGTRWARLTLFRDEGRPWFSPGDAVFVADVHRCWPPGCAPGSASPRPMTPATANPAPSSSTAT